MGLLDKFLDAIKLNDDYDDDDEFLDDDEDLEDEEVEENYKEEKPKKRFFQRFDDDDDDLEDDDDDKPIRKSEPSSRNTEKKTQFTNKKIEPDTDRSSRTEARTVKREKEKEKTAKQKKNSKITPINKKKGASAMEVNVIRPTSMEDAREIADTLLEECTVVLNLEGLDVDVAQRIIDFTCGACYSLDGSLQKISSYIYILAPSNVDISGDFQSILDGAFDIPSMKTQY